MLAARWSLVLCCLAGAGLMAQTDEQAAVLQSTQRIVPQLSAGNPDAARQVLVELPPLLARAQRLNNPAYSGVIETAFGRARIADAKQSRARK